MAKLTTADLSNLQNETSVVNVVNSNFAAVETAMENTLSRDGTLPNHMAAELDMNSNRIINLSDAISEQEPATYGQLIDAVDTLEDAIDAIDSGGGGRAGIVYVIDGGGVPISTGVKGDLEIPFNCTIQRATLLADMTGSIVVDVWRAPYASFPPTVANTITSATPPTISAANKSQDTTLDNWSKDISAGDVLRFNVNSNSLIQRVTLSLQVIRT